MLFGAFATGMMVDWEVKFAFGGGLGFDPEFALVSGPIELTEGALTSRRTVVPLFPVPPAWLLRECCYSIYPTLS